VRHVLASPERLRFLFGDGASIPIPLARFLRHVVPHASVELSGIAALARSIPDQRLRDEALSSINGKAYHVAGGCILATFLPPSEARRYVEIVAPLESIYDYLDNLCDRHPDVPVEAYPVLHQAIADALNPDAGTRDYYALGPDGDDNGYLARLVTRTQRSLRRAGANGALRATFSEAAILYGEMQTFKHYPASQREAACIAWFERRRDARFDGMQWYEFACAAGSQFQVYAPLFAHFCGRESSIADTYAAYFPSVAALHVLLDSFIDQAEDRHHRELNFAALYANADHLRRRVGEMAADAIHRFARLPDPRRHRFVLRVMALFYLTHPKVYAQGLQRQAESLLSVI